MVEHFPGVTDGAATIAAERERAAATGAPADANSLLVRIGGDALVAAPTAAWAARRAATGARVHRFRVDHPGPDPDLGAMHTADVPLLFGTYGDGGPGTRMAGDTPRAAAVSAAVMVAWGAFVRGEEPGWAPPDVAVFGGVGTAMRVEPGDGGMCPEVQTGHTLPSRVRS